MDWLMRHLYRMSLHSERTGMTSKNLAIVWSPNILRCDVSELDTQDALQVCKNQTVKPNSQSFPKTDLWITICKLSKQFWFGEKVVVVVYQDIYMQYISGCQSSSSHHWVPHPVCQSCVRSLCASRHEEQITSYVIIKLRPGQWRVNWIHINCPEFGSCQTFKN